MKIIAPTVAISLAMALSACSSDPAPGPTEQIVVREPGGAAPVAAAPAADTGSDGGNNLVAQGEAVFATCIACHDVAKDGATKAGPNLYGIIGKQAASVEGFAYSDALKSSSVTWSEAELDSYLADPVAKVPGTTMASAPMIDGNERAAVIAYIRDASSR